MALKRNYLSENAEVVDLHVFSDASLDAMCMVPYFTDQQTGELAYVVGKCRVAPMKQQSIPRLELQAAIYGTRLKRLIVDEHNVEIERTFFWTVSTTVSKWLHGAGKKQPVFVANRVAEILGSSTIDQWRQHVEGTSNPADIGTRGKVLSRKGANGSQGRHGFERKMLGHKLHHSGFNKKQKTLNKSLKSCPKKRL